MSSCKQGAAPAVITNPKADYSGPVVVDPITRIEGHYRVEVELDNGIISNVWTSAQLFRGLEIILQGRDPRDAQHFTQRSCGVCTHVHAQASIRSVDDALDVDIPANATLFRNLVMGQQYLHDHLVHFYHLHALDWVDVEAAAMKADPKKAAQIAEQNYDMPDSYEDLKAVQDKLKSFISTGQLGPFTNAYFLGGHDAYWLPPEVSLIATKHYLDALKLQVKAARGMAVFGGKNPHTQFMVAGGVTCYDGMTKDRINEFAGIHKDTMDFVNQRYIPDLLVVAKYYLDWARYGGTSNFLTCGEFPIPGQDRDLETRFMPPGFIRNRDLGNVENFDKMKIEEFVGNSWYKGSDSLHPWSGVTEPEYTSLEDRDRYSWFKTPTYDGRCTEVGPLAHCLVAYAKGHPGFKSTVDYVLNSLGAGPEALFSTLGRTAARGVETKVIGDAMNGWMDNLVENINSGKDELVQSWEWPGSETKGVGFADVPRGMLSHWLVMEDKKIKNYQLVVPSTWNLCPSKDKESNMSPIEEALMGTPVADPKRPVEILRTVHSYDPCIACGVHVIDSKTNEVHKFRVL